MLVNLYKFLAKKSNPNKIHRQVPKMQTPISNSKIPKHLKTFQKLINSSIKLLLLKLI